MINQLSLKAVEAAHFGSSFCAPLYESYCFSRIPNTVKTLFSGKDEGSLPTNCFQKDRYDAVFLLFIDGFGWRFFHEYAKRYPFLQRFIDTGIASKITSQFPSTTAGHATCIHTGLTPADTGIYEWYYFEPKVDAIIAPLLYSYGRDRNPGTLKSSGVAPEDIYPNKTIYQELKKRKIRSVIFETHNIIDSPYTNVVCDGAERSGYFTFEEALNQSLTYYQEAKTPIYLNLYFADIDAAGHRHGFDSKQFKDAVDYCFTACEDFWQKLERSGKRAAVLVTADHGMAAVSPKKTIYLNKKIPSIVTYLKRNRKGEVIAPAGSCRDFFLHVLDDHLKEAKEILTEYFKGIAEVYLTSTLIEKGFFGSKNPSQRFLERVGNLVILPYENEAIWWYEKHHFEQNFYAAHGGLTRSEMETIFLFNKSS